MGFPAGLRVLVVDHDHTYLKILEKMLNKCNYEVTTSNLAQEALDMLQQQKNVFDIVISDVDMPDMDGFKFLEHVGLKLDLPIIMISVDGETSKVMKGVQHGACDHLLKPIRMKELRNIWQHVFRKRMHEGQEKESPDETQKILSQSDDGPLFREDVISGKKRKEFDSNGDDRESGGDSSSVKKARVVWTVDLHQKFVKAVNRIGLNKVGPKKILDLMGVPWLTRENVASHLQKYRLYLSRLQKENELEAASGGLNLSDCTPKDHSGNHCLQSALSHSAVTMQHNIVINENSTLPGHRIQVHNNICEGDASGISFNQSFELLNSQVKSESKMQAYYTWSAGHPSLQFNNRSYAIGTENTLSVQPHLANFTNCHLNDPVQISTWSAKSHNLEENNRPLTNVIVGNGSAVRLREVEFNGYSSSAGDFYPVNPHLVNLESYGYSNQELVADVRSHSYDSENFDSEYPLEDHVISNQGLYFA